MSDVNGQNHEHWQRWQMEDLASNSVSSASGKTEAIDRQHEREQHAQLRTLHDKTRKQAYTEGFQKGQTAGHDEGFTRGREEGLEAGQHALDERRQQLEQPLRELVQGLHQALDQLDVDIGDTLTDVALAAAKRLAGDALDAQPEQVLDLIRNLLREEPLFSGHPRLWLHPDDFALLDDQLMDEIQTAGWKVQPDVTLERGGCRVTGPEGELNATREARWQGLLARARRYGSSPISQSIPPAANSDEEDAT